MNKAVHLLCPGCGQPFKTDRITAARDVLSPTQRRILDEIRAKQGRTVTQLANAVWEDDPNGGPLSANRNISVQISKANKRLEKFGLKIGASHRGIGATYMIMEL